MWNFFFQFNFHMWKINFSCCLLKYDSSQIFLAFFRVTERDNWVFSAQKIYFTLYYVLKNMSGPGTRLSFGGPGPTSVVPGPVRTGPVRTGPPRGGGPDRSGPDRTGPVRTGQISTRSWQIGAFLGKKLWKFQFIMKNFKNFARNIQFFKLVPEIISRRIYFQ